MNKNRISIVMGLFAMAFLWIIIQGCQKDQLDNEIGQITMNSQRANRPTFQDFPDNAMVSPEQVPPATVKLVDYPKMERISTSVSNREACAEALTPALLEATLKPGESITEAKTACLSGAPANGDVMFSMDLTGSMGDELQNMKMNSINIMNSIMTLFPEGGARFGVVSHMDYVGNFVSCGYSNSYGGGKDYPYQLNQALTSNSTDVANAINGLNLGWGADGPEDYERVFNELYTHELVEWRPGAAKLVVAWLDAPPHDCDWGTGSDPGRDGIMSTADDLDFDDQIQGFVDNNIKLIVLCSGDQDLTDDWKFEADKTGGTAVKINGDGTIPSGMTINEFITKLISDAVTKISTLRLVPEAGFEAWMTGCTPDCYTNIVLDCNQTFEYDHVTFTVPAGTPDGMHEFDLNLTGDGVVYGKQVVRFLVKSKIEVPVDIHPGSCPNPLNFKAQGKIPISISGTPDFDVSEINVSTIRMAGVAPIWNGLADTSTPFMPFVNKPLSIYSCNTSGGDGIMDLNLKFMTPAIANAIGPVSPGTVMRIILTGELNDGTEFIGEDIVKIVK